MTRFEHPLSRHAKTTVRAGLVAGSQELLIEDDPVMVVLRFLDPDHLRRFATSVALGVVSRATGGQESAGQPHLPADSSTPRRGRAGRWPAGRSAVELGPVGGPTPPAGEGAKPPAAPPPTGPVPPATNGGA